MALAQKYRDTIYSSWSVDFGDEAAEALLLHFPLREQDEPATKEFVQSRTAELRADVADLRGETRAGFAEVREEIRTGFVRVDGRFTAVDARFVELRGDLNTAIAGVRSEVAGLRNDMSEALHRQTGLMVALFIGVATVLGAVISILNLLG